MNNSNRLISGDNKGYASYRMERDFNGGDGKVNIKQYVRVYVCMYVCMYVHTYECMYIPILSDRKDTVNISEHTLLLLC